MSNIQGLHRMAIVLKVHVLVIIRRDGEIDILNQTISLYNFQGLNAF
jgi:hypothetical protein